MTPHTFRPRGLLGAVVALAAAMLPPAANAERATTFDGYTVHYNVVTTDILDPDVARTYRIVRSRQRAMLNIAVLEKTSDQTMQPVRADVSVTASNLNAQLRQVAVRPLMDGEAIYYIGEFPVNHLEVLNFTVTVAPEGSDESHTFGFSEQFYTR